MINIVKLFSCLAILIISHPCFSQVGKKDRPNQITISPLRLVDFINPGLEMGYERIYGNKFSTQVSVGYMRPILGVASFDDYHGWRFALEQKFFIATTKRKRTYWAVDAVYLKADYDYEGSFRKDTTKASPAYTDTFHTNKRTLAFNIKRGIQIRLSRFVLDLSAGIGIKYKMVERTELQNPNAIEIKAREPSVYEITNKPGNYFTFSLPANIRIGYRF